MREGDIWWVLRRVYIGFLELPVPVVLVAVWTLGGALLGLGALALIFLLVMLA
jgi:hypothetical protein